MGGRSTRLRRRADGLLNSTGRNALTPLLMLPPSVVFNAFVPTSLTTVAAPVVVTTVVIVIAPSTRPVVLVVVVLATPDATSVNVVDNADADGDATSLLSALTALSASSVSVCVVDDDLLANDEIDATPGMIEPAHKRSERFREHNDIERKNAAINELVVNVDLKLRAGEADEAVNMSSGDADATPRDVIALPVDVNETGDDVAAADIAIGGDGCRDGE
jgi:hypothetical protein